jgi:hypothetical protein
MKSFDKQFSKSSITTSIPLAYLGDLYYLRGPSWGDTALKVRLNHLLKKCFDNNVDLTKYNMVITLEPNLEGV